MGTPPHAGNDLRRHLHQRIQGVLQEWQQALDEGWNVARWMRLVAALGELGEAAGRQQMEAPALATRDAAAYIGFLLDTADSPNIVQQGRIRHYLQRLQETAAALAELLLREELEHPAVLVLHGPDGAIPGLADAFAELGWKCCICAEPAPVAAAAKGRMLVGVVIDSHWLSRLGEVVDALDQNRRPGATPPLLVVTRGGAIAEQLLDMTGSADAFIAAADATSVLLKLRQLQHDLSSAEPLRVLIVDDDRSQVVFCDAVLRRRGLTIQVAASADEALAQVGSFRPDLVLVDLYMPGVDGMALTARMRELPATLLVPIVFISGEQDVGKRVRAINIGGDDFLTKPVRPAHLIEVVVGRAKRARALRQQVLGLRPDAAATPLTRAALGQRLRNLRERPAALISIGIEQAEQLSGKLPALLRCEVEQAIAGRIAARLQPGDAYAPWHELHFLLLTARSDNAGLAQLAQSLRNAIDVRPVAISRGQLKVRARVQLVPADDDPQRWLDRALAVWKRGTVAPAQPATARTAGDDAPQNHGVLQPDAALCTVEYQPLVPTRGLRADQWHQRLRVRTSLHQAQGTLREDVLELARRAGTLARLDRIALRLAAGTAAVQEQIGRPSRLFVEVDAASLVDPGFIAFIEHECPRPARPGTLALELDTEMVIERQALLRPVLERLRPLGLQLCLRDFGMQNEASRLLQQIQVDAIKLDTEIALQPTLAFATILSQVREAGVPLIVEAVPDREAVARLWELGVDYIQCDLLAGYAGGLESAGPAGADSVGDQPPPAAETARTAHVARH